MKKHINERTLETLFNQYFSRCFKVGDISFWAPTNQEEAKKGYDGRYNGLVSACEIFFQFKAPSKIKLKSNDYELLDFDIQPHQLQKLKDLSWEKPNAVFLVTHTFFYEADLSFESLKEQEPELFLKNFVCINISDLPDEFRRIRYNLEESTPPIFSQLGQEKKGLNKKLIFGDELVSRYKKCVLGYDTLYNNIPINVLNDLPDNMEEFAFGKVVNSEELTENESFLKSLTVARKPIKRMPEEFLIREN